MKTKDKNYQFLLFMIIVGIPAVAAGMGYITLPQAFGVATFFGILFIPRK